MSLIARYVYVTAHADITCTYYVSLKPQQYESNLGLRFKGLLRHYCNCQRCLWSFQKLSTESCPTEVTPQPPSLLCYLSHLQLTACLPPFHYYAETYSGMISLPHIGEEASTPLVPSCQSKVGVLSPTSSPLATSTWTSANPIPHTQSRLTSQV